MKLYLAGPMRGYPQLNFPAFHRVAELLRRAGHVIFSPAETVDHDDPIDKRSGGAAKHPRAFWLRLDVRYLLDEADGIALLPGWEASPGACLEMLVCQEIEMPRFLAVDSSPDDPARMIELQPITARYAVKEDGAIVLAPRADRTVLEEAGALVDGDRARHYGHPRDNFRRVAAGWSLLTGATIDERMVGRMMIWLKLSRDLNLPQRDNLVDVAGYARAVERLDEPAA